MGDKTFSGRLFWLTAFACLVLAGCSGETESEPPPEASSPPPVSNEAAVPESPPVEPRATTIRGGRSFVLSLLTGLPVRAERPAGYDRELFADWIDRGDCDVREIVLARQDREDGRCGADAGAWVSPYDGERESDPSELDVDHFVPLAEAWASGASSWSEESRAAFSNDLRPYALIAVTASSNRSKSDGEPAEWMPENDGFGCQYLARWVAVKHRWGLSVDPTERKFLKVEIGRCPGSAVALNRDAVVPVTVAPAGRSNAPSTGEPGSGRRGSSSSDPALDPIFSSCEEALANGFGGYVRGKDSEYRYYEDRDSDGVVCE
jgi:hypothetical protein